MRVRSSESVPAESVEMEGARGVQMRILIGQAEGAPNFIMRQFEVEPGG